ncbi:MAG: hypothetical protein ABIH69_01940 [bacterium]
MKLYLHPFQNAGGSAKSTTFSKQGVNFWLQRQGIRFKGKKEELSASIDFGQGRESVPMGHNDRIDAFVSQAEVTRQILSDGSLILNIPNHIVEKSHPSQRDALERKKDLVVRLFQYYSGQSPASSNLEKLLLSVLENPAELMMSFYFSGKGNLLDFKLPIAEWMFNNFFLGQLTLKTIKIIVSSSKMMVFSSIPTLDADMTLFGTAL